MAGGKGVISGAVVVTARDGAIVALGPQLREIHADPKAPRPTGEETQLLRIIELHAFNFCRSAIPLGGEPVAVLAGQEAAAA